MLSMVPTEVAVVVGVAAVVPVAVPQFYIEVSVSNIFSLSVRLSALYSDPFFFSIRSLTIDAHAATTIFDGGHTRPAPTSAFLDALFLELY